MNSSREKNRDSSYHIITRCDKDLLYDADDESDYKENKKKIIPKRKKESDYCNSVFIMDL